MKNSYKLENLDCANCAAKMEDSINRIDGVSKATINFMTQKFTIEADDDKFDDIIKEAATLISEVEPDCKIIIK